MNQRPVYVQFALFASICERCDAFIDTQAMLGVQGFACSLLVKLSDVTQLRIIFGPLCLLREGLPFLHRLAVQLSIMKCSCTYMRKSR